MSTLSAWAPHLYLLLGCIISRSGYSSIFIYQLLRCYGIKSFLIQSTRPVLDLVCWLLLLKIDIIDNILIIKLLNSTSCVPSCYFLLLGQSIVLVLGRRRHILRSLESHIRLLRGILVRANKGVYWVDVLTNANIPAIHSISTIDLGLIRW